MHTTLAPFLDTFASTCAYIEGVGTTKREKAAWPMESLTTGFPRQQRVCFSGVEAVAAPFPLYLRLLFVRATGFPKAFPPGLFSAVVDFDWWCRGLLAHVRGCCFDGGKLRVPVPRPGEERQRDERTSVRTGVGS